MAIGDAHSFFGPTRVRLSRRCDPSSFFPLSMFSSQIGVPAIFHIPWRNLNVPSQDSYVRADIMHLFLAPHNIHPKYSFILPKYYTKNSKKNHKKSFNFLWKYLSFFKRRARSITPGSAQRQKAIVLSISLVEWDGERWLAEAVPPATGPGWPLTPTTRSLLSPGLLCRWSWYNTSSGDAVGAEFYAERQTIAAKWLNCSQLNKCSMFQAQFFPFSIPFLFFSSNVILR